MSNPVLPSGIKPVVEGYSMDDPGGVVRTEVAGGAARYALDWDRGTQRYQITLILDALLFSVWTVFYAFTIKKGALAFDMPIDSGFGVSPHAVNIVPGSYSAARTSGIMTVVSFVAEAENQVYAMTSVDGADFLAFYELYGAYGTGLLDRLNQFANHDSNVLAFA